MTEHVYIGLDNVIRRTLTDDGTELTSTQQAAVTRVTAEIGGTCLDTDVGSDPISYASGKVDLKLGLVAGLTPGFYTVRITAFDDEGKRAWGSFRVQAYAWPECE